MTLAKKYIFKSVIYIVVAVSMTLILHHFQPQQQIEFQHSYIMHVILDSLLFITIFGMIWEGNLRINTILDRKFRWEIKPYKRLFLQIVINTVYSGIIIIALTLLYGFLLLCLFSEVSNWEKLSETIPILRNALSLFIIILLAYQVIFICIYFFKQWSNSLIESERLKRENLHSQFHALQNQVNPHFLFNSLNTLISLIENDKKNAIEFVEKLSSVYRYLLKQQDEHLIRIADELNFIDSYIYLQKTRSGDSLKTEIKIDSHLQDYFIAPFTLQILVENAIKHNIISLEKPLTIKILCDDNNLVIENNLQMKKSNQPHTGIGLKNIIDRYRILGYNNIKVEESGNCFKVTVPIINPREANEGINH